MWQAGTATGISPNRCRFPKRRSRCTSSTSWKSSVRVIAPGPSRLPSAAASSSYNHAYPDRGTRGFQGLGILARRAAITLTWARPTTERRHQRSGQLQRFFSTFPSSRPGLGLLLLRIVAGGAAASAGVLSLTHMGEPNAGAWVLGL